MAGWGSLRRDTNQPEYPTALYEVNVPIKNLNLCRNNYIAGWAKQNRIESFGELMDSDITISGVVLGEMNICAGTGERDSCSVLELLLYFFLKGHF